MPTGKPADYTPSREEKWFVDLATAKQQAIWYDNQDPATKVEYLFGQFMLSEAGIGENS